MAERTAAFYMDFNSATPKNLQSTSHSFYRTGDAKILNVLDRGDSNSVLYLPGKSGLYAYISGFGNGCPM